MDCKFSKIKICQLKNSTFQSQLLNFGDFDISGYAFTAIFMSNKIKQSQQLFPIGNTLEIPFSILESEFGNTRVELWWKKDGINDIVVAFDVKIVSENCEECGNKTQHDVIVEINEGQQQIPVIVTQSIGNNLLDFDNLTEAQKAELKGDKGDAFTYADFTPQQITNLQQPAIDAANDANNINNAVQLAENTRISNENTRQSQESTRQTNESGRANAENTRVSNESARVSAENTRVSAENTRISNESTRHSQESTRQSNETTRQNQETTRQNNESARVSAENSRVSAESLRVSAENARILAEENRQGRELVAAVTLNNSPEIKVQSIDYATGIFTTTAPHGLVSGTRLSPISDLNSGVNFLPAVLPDGLAPGLYNGGLTIHDTTRFSINGVTMTSHAGVDFSKWHFENTNSVNHISLTDLNADYYEIEILGRILHNVGYLLINTNRVNLLPSIEHLSPSGASGSAIGLNRSGFLSFSAHFYYSGRITIDGRNGLIATQESEAIGSQTGANAKTQNVYYTDKRVTLDSRMTSGATQILSIQTITGSGFANGTKVFLYKRK